MPGAVIMENGGANGVATNHDRDPPATTTNGVVLNGFSSAAAHSSSSNHGVSAPRSSTDPSRWNDLPDEIQHITQGFVPLGLLVSRLAQSSHNALQDCIMAMAKMPAPTPSAMNGTSIAGGALPDDTSAENIRKKAHLLGFVQEEHAKWVKALVMTAWSRKAETVSKLIDLYNAINMQKVEYLRSVEHLIEVRKALPTARLGEPDLRTALQVLSAGEATWMPDLNYIEAPAISPKEKLRWIENTNTLLSLRLNLEEHDKIPEQFQNYKIESGRVVFTVPGEFEVDLTIADEDFEKQFWFIDFRFLFTPAPAELSDLLRSYLEVKVNEALEKDGLQGCYNFLHEFVLTHKITEYVRQAFELGRGKWVDTLKVERLNRAMSIQYWVGRYLPDGPKSWIIVGVHSGRKPGAIPSTKSTSRLTLRWFKDNKEVTDATLTLDDANISTERLLKKVIGRHVESSLAAIFAKLNSKGRFVKREAALSLNIVEDDPVRSSLKMQLGRKDYVTIKIAPTTGFFAITPQTSVTAKGENRLNYSVKDPADEGMLSLESIRCHYTVDEMNRRGRSMGWDVCKHPVKMDDIKPILNTREPFQSMWFRRRGWPDQWYLMLSLSLSGDRWWLVEITNQPTRIASSTQLPLSSGLPELSDKFFFDLTVFTAGMISHITDLRLCDERKIQHATRNCTNYSLPPSIRIPSVFIKLSDILKRPGAPGSKRAKAPSWALDLVQITFKGIRGPSTPEQSGQATLIGNNEHPSDEYRLTTLVDARFRVADAERFSMLQGNVERDVAFNNELGVFALRLQTDLGSPIFDALKRRLQAIERLVDCVDAIRRCERDVRCEDITLQQVTFSYSHLRKSEAEAAADQNIQRWKATLDLSKDDIRLQLEEGDPQLRVLDMYHHLLNSELRFNLLPYYLSITSPVQCGLDAIEAAWMDLTLANKGRVEIFHTHLDCFNIHYVLPGLPKGAERRAILQLRLKHRKGGVCWWIFWDEAGTAKNTDDEFKKAVQPVWGSAGKVWRNLGGSAACAPNHIETLLKAIDDAVRPLAMQSPKAIKQSLFRGQQPTKIQGMNQHTKMMGNKARPQQPGEVVVLD